MGDASWLWKWLWFMRASVGGAAWRRSPDALVANPSVFAFPVLAHQTHFERAAPVLARAIGNTLVSRAIGNTLV